MAGKGNSRARWTVAGLFLAVPACAWLQVALPFGAARFASSFSLVLGMVLIASALLDLKRMPPVGYLEDGTRHPDEITPLPRLLAGCLFVVTPTFTGTF